MRKGTAENILRVPIGCHALPAGAGNDCNAPMPVSYTHLFAVIDFISQVLHLRFGNAVFEHTVEIVSCAVVVSSIGTKIAVLIYRSEEHTSELQSQR